MTRSDRGLVPECALGPEARHDDQNRDELEEHTGAHQLIGPGPAEIAAPDERIDSGAEDQEHHAHQNIKP